MMKMATGDDSPSGRVPERGVDCFLVAIEACGGGTSDLGLSSGVLEYSAIYTTRENPSSSAGILPISSAG